MTKILAIGDVVGPDAVAFTARRLRRLRTDCGASLIVVNAENAAAGNGLDTQSAAALFRAGADVLTSGNHIWKKKEIQSYIDDRPQLLRPANYPAVCPGQGYTIVESDGVRFLVMNVMGQVYMDPVLADPFQTVERILEHTAGQYDVALLDVHAEATSEKIALARFFDGRIGAVWGTHTHVQTADETVFRGGTGYITDIGMTGPVDSVLGIRVGCILDRLRFKMPVKFETAEGPVELRGAAFTFGGDGKCTAVERIVIKE